MDAEYPRWPDGLTYNTAFGASAILHCARAWEIPIVAMDAPCQPDAAPAERQRSVYRGVALLGATGTRKRHWRAEAKIGGVRLNGPARPYTDAGERQAAYDYAAFVGLSEPVLRSE